VLFCIPGREGGEFSHPDLSHNPRLYDENPNVINAETGVGVARNKEDSGFMERRHQNTNETEDRLPLSSYSAPAKTTSSAAAPASSSTSSRLHEEGAATDGNEGIPGKLKEHEQALDVDPSDLLHNYLGVDIDTFGS